MTPVSLCAIFFSVNKNVKEENTSKDKTDMSPNLQPLSIPTGKPLL